MRSRTRSVLLVLTAAIAASILAALGLSAVAYAQSPTMSVSPVSGPPGQEVVLGGGGFNAYTGSEVEIDISIDFGNGNWQLLVAGAANPVPDANGDFAATIATPSDAPPGDLLVISSITEPEADTFFTVTGSSGTGTSAPARPGTAMSLTTASGTPP